jgi:hypothetical protein
MKYTYAPSYSCSSRLCQIWTRNEIYIFTSHSHSKRGITLGIVGKIDATYAILLLFPVLPRGTGNGQIVLEKGTILCTLWRPMWSRPPPGDWDPLLSSEAWVETKSLVYYRKTGYFWPAVVFVLKPWIIVVIQLVTRSYFAHFDTVYHEADEDSMSGVTMIRGYIGHRTLRRIRTFVFAVATVVLPSQALCGR